MTKRPAAARRTPASPLLEPLETRTLLAIELVKDINPSATTETAPGVMADINGVAYFINTYKLWKSDGTAAGTVRINNITNEALFFSASFLCNVSGTLFLNGNGNLWKSDGTAAGTVQVTPASINPRYITAIGSRAYFRGNDGSGDELWVSDGTEGGTFRLKDVNPGAAGSDPRQLINVNGRLFFRARDAAGGDELWTSDGTEAGTVRVKDINPGAAGSEPVSMTNVNGTLFFAAHDADDSGYELWKSDGTGAGTVRVKDIRPGKPGSSPTLLRNVNGTLMFVATDGASGYELWKSDGTEAGTVLVKEIIAGSAGGGIDQLTAVGGMAFFTADADDGAGIELWKTDGTAAGTTRVKDIYAGASSSAPGMLTALGSQVFFVANDGVNGQQIWKSDGTAVGTTLLGGPPRFSQAKFNVVGNKIFFTSDGASGATLWVTDGTAAGTFQRPISYEMGAGADVSPPVRVGSNTIYFLANDGVHGNEIWKSDGSEAGTQILFDSQPGIFSFNPTELTDYNGTLVFAMQGKLWKSDGTEAGTAPLSSNPMSPSKFKVVGSTLYFLGWDGGGQELWKSDGSEAGTMRVADVRPGGASSQIDQMTGVNGALYFIADNGTSGFEVWKSDGTPGGTAMVKDIIAGTASSGPYLLTNANGTLYFRARDNASGYDYELWKSDGTAGGTVRVKDIRAGAASSVIDWITAVGSSVFFVADDGVHGQELWKSDGTAAGTTMLRDIHAGAQGSSPTNLTEVGGKLLFRGDDGISGAELWQSDGTAGGTQILEDLNPGAASSDPMRFFNVDGKLAFEAFGGAGAGIWTSDGTAAGTFFLPDTSDARFPGKITGFGGNLYFSGYTFLNGVELRRLAVPASAPAPSAIASGAPVSPSAPAGSPPLFEPSAAFADGDIFYDTLGRPLKPDAVATSGVSPASLYGNGFYTDWDIGGIDEQRMRGIARQVAALGNQPLILDIEHWPLDIRFWSEGQVQTSMEKLLAAVDWIHDERPNLKVGFYSIAPNEPVVAARIGELFGRVDELYPSLYSNNPWEATSWRAFAETLIPTSQTYGKPARSFLWPQYFYNPDQSGRLLPANVWRMELDTVHDLGDGAILWDTGGNWLDDAPWWTVTRDFLIDPTPNVPAAPAGLSSPFKNASRVDLSWTDKAYNDTGWRVQRRLGASGPFVNVATLAANAHAYSDLAVSASSSYTYRVVAFNAGGESLASNEVAVTTSSGNIAPAAPVNVSATGMSSVRIRVSWVAGSQNVSGFKIERSDNGASFAQIGTAAAGATSFDDTGAALGVNYQYRVRAYNAFGDSPYSAVVAGAAILSSKDPRGIWKLDDASGLSAADSSGGGHAGTLAGGAAWSSGTLGGALTFDGVDDRVVVTDSADLRFTAGDDFTISAWVNLTSLPGHRVGVVTKAGNGIFIDATNHWAFGNIAGPLATTGWTLVTAAQNGAVGTRKLYVNGVEVASGAAASANAAGDLWIGGSGAAGEYFAGKIDDLRIYGDVWTAAEIDALAHPRVTLNGTAGNDTILIETDPANDNYRFIVNGVTAGMALRDAIASIDVLAGGGDDLLTVDFAGGEAFADYGITYDGGSGKDTLKLAGNRPNISFAAGGTNLGRNGNVLTHSSVEALTIAAAAATVSENLGTDLRVETGGVVTFTVAQKLTSLTLAGGRVDVTDVPVAVNYSASTPIADLTAAVTSGRNSVPIWNGNGITTSEPAAASMLTTVVPVEASDFLGISGSQTSTWFGMAVDATTVLLVYAWAGDADMNGVIDGDDYFVIDSGFGNHANGYLNGDFDFNGVIDADDYFIIDKNNGTGGVLPAAPAAASTLFMPKTVFTSPSEPEDDRSLLEEL